MRQSLAGLVDFPVIRVALKDDPLARHDLLESERTQADDALRIREKAPRARELAALIGLFESMAGQDVERVEQPFARGIGPGELEGDTTRTELARPDRLPTNDKKSPLRGVDRLVEIDPQGEQHVVHIDGVTIRETNALAKGQRIAAPILGDVPI